MTDRTGSLIISLDFELYWGVVETKTPDSYHENLSGAILAAEEILKLFSKYKIQATWATVGMLVANNSHQLEDMLPDKQPTYDNPNVSTYEYIKRSKEFKPDFHFANEVVQKILADEHQELGSHTFSHYFTLESGQTADQFDADLNSMLQLVQPLGADLQSIVFPRDQVNTGYLKLLSKYGLKYYRSPPAGKHFSSETKNSYLSKLVRFLDSYTPIFGLHTFDSRDTSRMAELSCIPASHFLRPHNSRFPVLDKLQVNKIKKSIKYAAKKQEAFHLWWHPHNFGKNRTENLNMLENILTAFCELRDRNEMQSCTMRSYGEYMNQRYSTNTRPE